MNKIGDSDSKNVLGDSLIKVAKGTAIAFLGMIIYLLLEFITRVIIARNTTQGEYGTFSIGLTLLSVFVMISCLGLQGGATRCIAYFRGKGDEKKVAGVIYSSLQLSIITGIVSFLFIFLFSDYLQDMFNLDQSTVIKIFSVGIPFFVITEIIASFFRGFDSVKEKVFFRDFLMSILKVLLLAIVIFLGLPFIQMIFVYILAIVISSIVFIVYSIRKLPTLKNADPMRKKLLTFSLPLLVAQASGLIILWIDTLMLGYFKGPDVVGIYNTAHPISQLTRIFLMSLVFIYMPIASQLFSKNHFLEMQRNYIIISKWIFSVSFPFFLIIFLFPEAMLGVFFGAKYITASTALQILSLGMLAHVFLGPNGATQIVIGKTKLNMINGLIGAFLNVCLNLVLIPAFGIVGASIASAISIGVVSVLTSVQIFYSNRIHPFSLNYLKPIIASAASILVIYVLIKEIFIPNVSDITFWTLSLLTILFSVVYVICYVITRSLDEEDMIIIQEIERMTGIDISPLERILRRFM